MVQGDGRNRALKVIQDIYHHAPFSMAEPIAEHIRSIYSNTQNITVHHSSGIANQIAHDLAKRSLPLTCNLMFLHVIPLFIGKSSPGFIDC